MDRRGNASILRSQHLRATARSIARLRLRVGGPTPRGVAPDSSASVSRLPQESPRSASFTDAGTRRTSRTSDASPTITRSSGPAACFREPGERVVPASHASRLRPAPVSTRISSGLFGETVLSGPTDAELMTMVQKPAILVVDDDPDMRRYLRRCLGSLTDRVVEAVDGAEALTIVCDAGPGAFD